MAKVGRPTKYSPALASKICAHIAEGKSMRKISKLAGMPTTAAMFKWMGEFPEFMEQYDRAKQEQAEHFAEEIVEIADDGVMTELIIDGVPVVDPDTGEPYKIPTSVGVQHARLRVDSRKWIASKLRPKRYGEKVTTEHQALDKKGEPTNWTVEFINSDLANEGKDD